MFLIVGTTDLYRISIRSVQLCDLKSIPDEEYAPEYLIRTNAYTQMLIFVFKV